MIRAVLAAAVTLSTATCIEDRCELGESSRLLFVYPETNPRNDTTNPHVFTSIQDALDAAPPPRADALDTTVCVADGVYREQLTVPGGVRVLGRGADRVRLRPPGGRDDEALIRVETEALTTARLEGLDIGGTTGPCVSVSGEGTTSIQDSRLLECGVALHARGDGMGTLRLSSTPIARSELALDVDSMALVEILDTDISGNADLLRVRASGDPAAEGEDGRGGGVLLQGVRLTGNDGAVVISDSRVRILDARVRDAERTAPGAPLLSGVASGFHLARVDIGAVGGRPLLAAEGGRVGLDSVAWDGTDAPGGTVPVISLSGAATLHGVHLTFLGAAPTVDADAAASATIANSILWGQDAAVRGDGAVDVRDSLVEDPNVPSETGNPSPSDPELDGIVPGAASPARCAGDVTRSAGSVLDLFGAPRPAEPEKAPDLGAVEVQEGCP